MADSLGNVATYLPDHSVALTPRGVTGPATSPVDFAPATVTVTGSSVNTAAPTLSSLSMSGHQIVAGSP